MLGVSKFLTEASWGEEKEDSSSIARAKKNDDDGLSLRVTQIAAVKRMQSQFHGHILRRTSNSMDWKGDPLIQLPPYKEIIGLLDLTERETNIIQERAELARARYVADSHVKFIAHPVLQCHQRKRIWAAANTGKYLVAVNGSPT
jgi:TATA-binding protein-associated factor